MKNPMKRWDVFLALVFFLIAIPAEYQEIFTLLEDQTLAFRHIFRMSLGDPEVTRFSDEIVLVSLDEELYEEYGSYPFRREDLGKIARILSSVGAKVVAMDSLMDYRSSYDEDEPTAALFAEAGNVLLASRLVFDDGRFLKLVYPTEELRAVSASGYVNVESASAITDNITRLTVHKQVTNNKDGWPFAIQTLAMYWGVEPVLEGNVVTLGDHVSFPLDQSSGLYIDFPALTPGTQYLNQSGFSALEILDLEGMDEEELAEWQYLFEDKIVFVGDTSEVSQDKRYTPVGLVYGVEIMADTVHTLLHGAPLRPARLITEIGASFAFLLVLLTACFIVKPLPRVMLSLVTFVAYVLVVSALYIYQGMVLSMSYALIAGFWASVIINLRFYLLSVSREEASAADSAESNRMLGLAYQGQGQLDAAFDKYRHCPPDEASHDLLYNLGLDYERKRQFNKAQSVYEVITEADDDYRDVQKRITRSKSMEEAVLLGGGRGMPAGGTLIAEDGSVEKPMLGRYQLEKELGQGAMGIVYLGKDPKINRQVAIKTMALKDEFDGDELQEVKDRFFREAESAGRLNHPNIVSIYDAGEEHDLAYIAMELLKGKDLDDHVKIDNLLPLDKVLNIVIKCAEGLHYAHTRKIVHRDIKPSNIMYEPEEEIAKITDFGIARITDSSKTRTGTVLGTPNYMSPEQCMGKKVDGRSDLFSLGVVLYQLVCGDLPFKGDSMATLMYAIVNDPPVDIKKVKPDISPILRKVIHNAIGKRPEKRYQSGRKMAEHLNVCLQKLEQDKKAAAS